METNKSIFKKISKIVVAGGFTFFFIKGLVWIIVILLAMVGIFRVITFGYFLLLRKIMVFDHISYIICRSKILT